MGAGPRGVVGAGTTTPPPRNGVGVGAAGDGEGGGTVAVGVINTATFGVGERCGDAGASGTFVSARYIRNATPIASAAKVSARSERSPAISFSSP